MSAWDGEADDIGQRVAFVMVARSPIERLVAFKQERGWQHLRALFSDTSGDYTRDYGVTPRTPTCPASTSSPAATEPSAVLERRRDGRQTADPGEDPRGAPDLMPLWNILDLTPGGRGTDWYPKLSYGSECGSGRRIG